MATELKYLDLTGLTTYDTNIKSYVQNQVASAGHLKRTIVDTLPEVANADVDTIYMIKDASVTSGDAYQEYMVIDGAWAQIGDTTVDLTDYAKTEYVDTQDAATLESAKAYADEKVADVPTMTAITDAEITALFA